MSIQERKANAVPIKSKNCVICLAEFNRKVYKCGQKEPRKAYEERETCCELCARMLKKGKAVVAAVKKVKNENKVITPPPSNDVLPPTAPRNAQYLIESSYLKVTERGVFRHDGFEWVKSAKTALELYSEVRRLRLAA